MKKVPSPLTKLSVYRKCVDCALQDGGRAAAPSRAVARSYAGLGLLAHVLVGSTSTLRVDDHIRLAYAATLSDQTSASATRFFHLARAQFPRFGLSCRYMLADHEPCCCHWRFQKLLHGKNLRKRFTRPYTPRTSYKAERYIQIALREWAYSRTHQNSTQRTQQLELWLHDYNLHRPHSSLNLKPPASRAGLSRSNL